MKGEQKRGMGQGMPRKPVEQHVADGTFRASRHAAWKAPVESLSTDIEPTEIVKGDAAEIWREIVADLPKGTLHRLDRFNLERYCIGVVKSREIAKHLLMCDPLDKSHYNLVQTLIMINKMLENLGDVLGMTKVSRDKIIKEAEKEEVNPFEALRLSLKKSG